MRNKKALHSGTAGSGPEAVKSGKRRTPPAPEIVRTASGLAPNYDAFPGMPPEAVLAFCNMD